LYNCARRSLRNWAKKCLDVWRGQNRNGQPVTFWNCHNGANQGWGLQHINILKSRGIKGRYPVKDGVKFMLRSRMPGGKMIIYHSHVGRGQYVLRIANFNTNDKRAYWVFDSRTRTIRVASHRGLVISNFAYRPWAVVSTWRG
jgi:hypothetical protein